MSVRMALAKLCACTCGGAIIGGGAVHVADTPPAQGKQYRQTKTTKPIRGRQIAKVAPRKVKRARRMVARTPVQTPQVITVTTQQAPIPLPLPAYPQQDSGGFSGGGLWPPWSPLGGLP